MFCHHHPDSRWQSLPKPVRIAGHLVIGLALAAIFAVLFGYVTMLLWNAVLPDISALPRLTFWQAAALLLLARLLAGRFSHGPHGAHFHNRHRRHRASSIDAYADWWDAEGAAAFRDYQQRRRQGSDTVSPDGR